MTHSLLQDWLDVATGGLCDDAKERVRAEVEAHYAAAYESLIAEGQTVDVAESGALESLGSAKAAQDRFTNTYFTITEFDTWQKLQRPRSAWAKGYATILMLLIVASVVGEAIRSRYLDNGNEIPGFVGAYLWVFCIGVLPVLLGRRFPSLVLVLQIVLTPLWAMGSFVGVFQLMGVSDWRITLIGALLAAQVTYLVWRLNASLIRKLNRNDNRKVLGL